jgi:RNA polymerase sigma factor (TIGR02999 family)
MNQSFTPCACALAGMRETTATPADTADLFHTLYEELSRMARREVRRHGGQHLVGTGTLVHEAWLDISRRKALAFDEHGRFLAYAARTMRGLMIGRLRARQARKRGGGLVVTSLDTHNVNEALQPVDLDHLTQAMDELAAVESDLADVVDLKFFCGFTLAEIATMKRVSERTVQRQWEKARMLLRAALS